MIPQGTFAACTVSTTALNFGIYDVFGTIPVDSTGTITVPCDESPPPTVTIAVGPSPNSRGFFPRQMKHLQQPDFLAYNLFTDASRSTVWGDGTQGTSVVSDKVHENRPWVVTIHGRIPSGQDVSAGPYREVITVTIAW